MRPEKDQQWIIDGIFTHAFYGTILAFVIDRGHKSIRESSKQKF